MLRYRRDRVATTPSATTGTGHRRCGTARPPRNALRRFTFVRDHDTPWPLPDPPSRKLRSATSRTGTARSIPGRALASSVLDSPCQGSRTKLAPPISTSVPSTPDLAARLCAGAIGLPSRRDLVGALALGRDPATARRVRSSAVNPGRTARARSMNSSTAAGGAKPPTATRTSPGTPSGSCPPRQGRPASRAGESRPSRAAVPARRPGQ
jgi:hypothetical protein